MFNSKNSVGTRYILLHDFSNEKIRKLTFLKSSPRIRALYHVKKFLKRINTYKSRHEDLFDTVVNTNSTAWTNYISHVDVTYSQYGKGMYEITFKNGESISVTYDELHSQSKMVKKIKSKLMVTPPQLIPSEYEKVELFVILKERRDKMAEGLDNVKIQPERSSQKKRTQDSKYKNGGELPHKYNMREVKTGARNNRYAALGGIR